MKYLPIAALLGLFLACGGEEATSSLSLGSQQQYAGCDVPAGCGNHCKTINVRTRTVNQDTYLHTMSNACVPYGPVNGTMSSGSHFDLYFSDPYEPLWCYGYSIQLGIKGYVLCSSLS